MATYLEDAAGSGHPVGKDRVQKLVKLHGIKARGKRQFKVTTDSYHGLPISPNVLNREFTVAESDKVWVGDITYIATDEGWLFLAVAIDLFSRHVVGLVAEGKHDARHRHRRPAHGLVQAPSRQTIWADLPQRPRQSIRQSRLQGLAEGVRHHQFNESARHCWGNACSETLFGSLKVERLHGQKFETRRQAKDEVIAWLLW